MFNHMCGYQFIGIISQGTTVDIMTRMVSIFLVLVCQIGLSIQACNECTCCKGVNTCNSNMICIDGCVDGYYGDKCTAECLKNCKTCVNGNECTKCKPGYYTDKCNVQCGKGCINSTCLILSGECQCKSTNFTKGKCDACVGLRYGDECNDSCPSNCGTCTSGIKCLWCKGNDYYGSYCQYRCSVGCDDGSCNKTGYCTKGCKSGYTGDKCDTCSSGLHGRFCDLNCTENCLTCLSATNCSKCKLSFYGKACTKTCPTGCDGNCSLLDGRCFECKPGFYGEYCNHTCRNETYGANCSQQCRYVDEHCNACITSDSGIYGGCTTCDRGHFLDTPFGYNYSICSTCSNNCTDKVCDTGGLCNIGCVQGKWGERCNFDCTINCLACNQTDGQCLECTHDTFSDNCSHTCRSTCKRTENDRTCAQDTGRCLQGCKSLTKYGKYCEKHCSFTCNDKSCDWKTGHCLDGCEVNYFGSFCDKTCADACQSIDSKRVCDDENGNCLYGCKAELFGKRCENKCDSQCLNTTCNHITGDCLYGCIQGFKGPKCVEPIQPDKEGHTTGTPIGSIIGSFVAGVIIVGVAALCAFIVWRRRHEYIKQADKHVYENTPVSGEHRPNDNALDSDTPVTYEDLKSRDERLYSELSTSRQISPLATDNVN